MRVFDGAKEEYAVTGPHPSWPTTGVVATLHQVTDDCIRLTFDDVSAFTTLDSISWKRHGLFKYRDFNASRLRELKLTQPGRAESRENLLMRLLATLAGELRDGNYRAT